MFILYQRGAVTINEVNMKWDALLSCKCGVPPNDSNLSVSISVQHSSVNSDLPKRSVVVCVWICIEFRYPVIVNLTLSL